MTDLKHYFRFVRSQFLKATIMQQSTILFVKEKLKMMLIKLANKNKSMFIAVYYYEEEKAIICMQ